MPEENSEAFAGQHAVTSTSFVICDEDSAIPPIIHEVAENALNEGEPMMFRFGNPTRNNGDFYKCVFGKRRDQWQPTIVDARTSRFSNKALLARRIEETGGEDGDYARVRGRGLPPKASDAQFIDLERVNDWLLVDAVVGQADCANVGTEGRNAKITTRARMAIFDVHKMRKGEDLNPPPFRVYGFAHARQPSSAPMVSTTPPEIIDFMSLAPMAAIFCANAGSEGATACVMTHTGPLNSRNSPKPISVMAPPCFSVNRIVTSPISAWTR